MGYTPVDIAGAAGKGEQRPSSWRSPYAIERVAATASAVEALSAAVV